MTVHERRGAFGRSGGTLAREALFEAGPQASSLIVAAMVAAVGSLDYLSPRYITFGAFYRAITAYATWTLGRRPSWLVSVATIALSISINGFGGYVALASGRSYGLAIAWNLASRMFSSLTIVGW